MKVILQRVKKASVTIENELYSSINQGILVLLGVEKGDTEAEGKYLAEKIIKLRMFDDSNQKMNLSVQDIQGEILVVSQFTLAADCKKGTRPSFDKAAEPELANELYEKFIQHLKNSNISVKTGVFKAMMDISLINDGPVTFVLNK